MDYKSIRECNEYILIESIKNFKLKQIFECGQCFRFEKISDTNYIVVAFERVIELIEDGENILIYNSNESDVRDIWIKYFDLHRDYSYIKNELSKDDLLRKSIEFGTGIRILNQDPFEILISFIISARNSIPSIMKTINKISTKWGTEILYKGKTYYAFPTIEQIKNATLEEIQETGASFRSKYIIDTIANVYSSKQAMNQESLQKREELKKYDLDYIKSLNDDDCHKALQEFKGVGAKVADCVMLFSMEKYSAFPVDVWVKRAMIHFYGAQDASLNKIRIFARNKFGKLSGFAQQYLFYYARENKIKIDEE
ncbi:DNA-3-methyladenine glycosylase family protein [Clostridium saccharobutylicum]|uniref:DNA-(apurinic or apyrimidinic site) lyase n=1 Tax=Clostridium saccharobutylicum DSM 13864 TaxID=1345695 RepID=U5MPT5_CLOSA|nr:DNA glycosylase [Clostridium saccharobutylicum]AGX41412.1 N-glycosylase/DNA lyase [Clostridium saccharobutylicum DSM 13864]AQR88692.1 DNA-3-methyladenine glycosylase [Clostridium saccharobutylicum]AQR98590.1 DNA-3-methyladenine glycosylase [Clostridium saccharobutylicum]AQS12580.1 DNA-3-methyladenine glycosylase [Clostridium saccharobutylicum]MBA2905599.1 N-glycosylase/DNA lyase [Clostridium saccharobutylicum]